MSPPSPIHHHPNPFKTTLIHISPIMPMKKEMSSESTNLKAAQKTKNNILTGVLGNELQKVAQDSVTYYRVRYTIFASEVEMGRKSTTVGAANLADSQSRVPQ